jgi:hypothetical protein
LKDIKDLKKTEIWGVIVITVFDLSAIIAALSNLDKLGITFFFLFVLLLQGFLTPLYIKLFLLYEARLGVDDMHEAARNTHITLEQTNELAKEVRLMVQTTQETIRLLQMQAKTQIEACVHLNSCPMIEGRIGKKSNNQ